MKLLICVALVLYAMETAAQSVLYFGFITDQRGRHQARFEVDRAESIKQITYAPYGITPVTFSDLVDASTYITFRWQRSSRTYDCKLKNLGTSGFVAYEGYCRSDEDSIRMLIRDFTGEDAAAQGNELKPSMEEVVIIERAEQLLNNGRNWNRKDERVCDVSSYPYQWSLFCALHQASIDVDTEYRHIRPAMKAVRDAIQKLNPSRKYAHLLRDFNNEATSFEEIKQVLHKAKANLAAEIPPGK